VKKPEDLKGRKVGVPEYQLTANVWARAFLEDDYGVKRFVMNSRRFIR
jgi:4,5-dihydroxyphthalate decarboxylase